ncbi:MAG: hypothetical protein ACRD44_17540 [Bryobacteraceae bacterium]
MAPFEDDLKQHLVRHEPPADFTAKVMARVAASRRPRRSFAGGWLAIGSLAASLVIGGYYWREQRVERARAEQARDDIVRALEITNTKIEIARQAVRETLRRN